MRNPLTTAALLTLAVWAASAAPASAAQIVDSVAKQECREERRFERWEFRQDRGTGAAALRRCVREQKREARWDCREERREDPAEYRYQYGTGKAGFKRCMIDEIR